jgi:hypothetical protein
MIVLSNPLAKVSLIVPLFRFYVLLEIFIGGKLLYEKHLFKKLISAGIMLLGMFTIVFF